MLKRKKTFIIAEVGTNHNGSIKTAFSMIRKIAKTGVDAIKFQLANPEDVYSDDAFKADYQKRNDASKSIVEMSKRLQLKETEHYKLSQFCKKNKVIYLCSAFDLKSLVFLDKRLKIPIFKIPSGEIHSTDMINYIAKKNKEIFVSTGMATLDEIGEVLKKLKGHGNKKITILHCISSYPANKNFINLNVMDELKKVFKVDVGYSDHSLGNEACLAAVAKGAKVIEKHVTLSINQKGPDHKASSNIKDISDLVLKIRKLETILGSNTKKFSKEELNIRKVARKSLVTKKETFRGKIVSKQDIVFKRPGTGISPLNLKKIIGRKFKKNIKKNKVIKFSDII